MWVLHEISHFGRLFVSLNHLCQLNIGGKSIAGIQNRGFNLYYTERLQRNPKGASQYFP